MNAKPIALAVRLCIFAAIILLCPVASGAETISAEHHFPQGFVPLTDVLSAPNTNGGLIAGVGHGDWEKHPLHRGLGSWVYPADSTPEPLITLVGTNWHLHDFSLHGGKPDEAVPAMLPRAGILVKFQPGVGSGGHVIERVNITNVVAGIQFGDDADSMCDTTNVRKANIKHCDYAILQTNPMAMENTFEAIAASSIRKAAFRFADGGNNAIRDCTLSTVRPAGVSQVAFLSLGEPASNNWTYTIANCKLDKQCGAEACLLDMDKPLQGTVTIIGSQVAYAGYGQGKHLFNLHDSIRITIIGGSNLLQKNAIFVKRDWPKCNPPTVVIINHDRCASPEEMVAPGSASVYVHCIDCGTQQSDLPGGRMMRFSFNNLIDRSGEATE